MEERVTFTMKELKTANILQQLIDGKIKNKDAARKLGLTVRQI